MAWPGCGVEEKGGRVASAGVFVSLSEYSGKLAAICFVPRPLEQYQSGRSGPVLLLLP